MKQRLDSNDSVVQQNNAEPYPAPQNISAFSTDAVARPIVETAVVLLTIFDAKLQALLIQLDTESAGLWAIPSAYVSANHGVEETARRQLEHMTGQRNIYLEQLYTFGDIQQDPRGRVVSVVYFALGNESSLDMQAVKSLAGAQWWPVISLPSMAYNHDSILRYTLKRMQGKLEYTTIGFHLVSEEFTLRELQNAYEAILNRELDKRNFRKKIFSIHSLDETSDVKMEGPHRPARLYRRKTSAETL